MVNYGDSRDKWCDLGAEYCDLMVNLAQWLAHHYCMVKSRDKYSDLGAEYGDLIVKSVMVDLIVQYSEVW